MINIQIFKNYTSMLFYTLALFPVLLQSLNAKNTLLTANGGGYEVIALQKGYSSFEQLNLWEKYSPFISDLLVSGIFLPATLILILLIVKHNFRTYLTTLCVLIPSLILFIQIKCFWEVGTFLPFSILVAGLTDTGNMFLAEYVNSSSLLKLAALLSFSFFMIYIANRIERQHKLTKTKNKPQLRRFLMLATTLCIASATWAKAPLNNEYSNSILVNAVTSFANIKEFTTSKYDNLEPAELLKEYKIFTNSNYNNTKSEYWGKAKDYDVLFFILESVPTQCANPTTELNDLPNIDSLTTQAFVSNNHYTTYPYTVRALFSIYSSWYPSNQSKDFIKTFDNRGEALKAPGVVRSLKELGYKTAVFVPDDTDNWEHDKQRYEALGFDKQIFPTIDSLKDIPRGNAGWRDTTEIKDVATLALLKTEMTSSLNNDERYVYAYQPQYTHGPWPNITPSYSLQETMNECTKLLKTVDKWIGEVLRIINKHDRLDKTLIVITGDHGIRTNKEHPGFNGGTIDKITFNVPLLIYSPGVISQPTHINTVTSHIDITPSLLNLLGVEEGRKYEQGAPIWDPYLNDRYVFFLAKNYLGADAFYYKNNISMIRHLFKNTKQTTWDNQQVFHGVNDTSKEVSESITTKINDMNNLQNNWARMLLPSTMEKP